MINTIRTSKHDKACQRKAKKKKKSLIYKKKIIDRILPYENKSINDSDHECGEGGEEKRIPYSSPLPAPAVEINRGSKKSEIRNL